jgi:Domain of unknown function (DUF4112)
VLVWLDRYNARVHEPRVRPDDARLDVLRRWGRLLDDRFRIPGTGIRFGIDPLIGLIPGLGDVASPLFTVALLLEGVRRRVPKVVLARMVLHGGLDALLVFVPVLGNVADVFWRANRRNLALLERHARPGVPPTRADYVFLWIALAILFLLTIVPIIFAFWLLMWARNIREPWLPAL